MACGWTGQVLSVCRAEKEVVGSVKRQGLRRESREKRGYNYGYKIVARRGREGKVDSKRDNPEGPWMEAKDIADCLRPVWLCELWKVSGGEAGKREDTLVPIGTTCTPFEHRLDGSLSYSTNVVFYSYSYSILC